MKTKETIETKSYSLEKTTNTKSKPKSLRPMRSLVATRSFKPKTTVTNFVLKGDELIERRD